MKQLTKHLHHFRLLYRSVIFVSLLVFYIASRVGGGEDISQIIESRPALLVAIWAVFVVEMVSRFFPSRLENRGCQKQFGRYYIPTGSTEVRDPGSTGALKVLLVWIAFNMIFGALYLAGILDEGVMLLLCSFYAVCDIICILYFCPFQSWIMKNRCCVTCRVYNWDYAMMFTPLFFVAKPYAWSLLFLSLVLLARWEITYYRHPERFSESTNEFLSCRHCQDKLCAHKKPIHNKR